MDGAGLGFDSFASAPVIWENLACAALMSALILSLPASNAFEKNAKSQSVKAVALLTLLPRPRRTQR